MSSTSRQQRHQRIWEIFLPLNRFPWLLFVVTWLITFGLQGRMNASLLWLNGGEASSDMATEVADGSLERRVLGLLLGLIGVMLVARFGRSNIRLTGLLPELWILFVGWSACSIFWSDKPAITVKRLLFFLFVLAFTGGCALLAERVVVGFALGFIVLNLIVGVVAELFCGTFKPFQAGYRFAGTFHPNLQGASLALGVLFALWWRRQSRKANSSARRLLFLITAGCACFLGLTDSRTSIVALLAALLFSGMLIVLRDRPRLVPVLSVGVALIFAVWLTAWLLLPAGTLSSSSLIETNRDNGDPSELTGRVDVWKECLQYSALKPWTGYGFNSFWSADH